MYLGVEMWMFFAALSSSSIFLRVCHMTLDDVLISQKYINVIFFFLCAYIFLCMIALVIPPQIIKLALLILTQCAPSPPDREQLSPPQASPPPRQVRLLRGTARPQHRRRPLARPRTPHAHARP